MVEPIPLIGMTTGGTTDMFHLVPLVGALCNFVLALFVLSQGTRPVVHRVYALLGLCIAIWNFGTFQMFQMSRVTNEAQAIFWARFLQFGVIFIPLLLFHLSLLIAEIPVGRYIYLLYTFCILLATGNLIDFFNPEVRFFLSGARKVP